MGAARDGWYVADADGEAAGPLPRELLGRYAQRRDLDALTVWHVDWSEWRPLAAVLGPGGAAGGERPARAQGSGASTSRESRAARSAGVALPPEVAARSAELKARLQARLDAQAGTRGGAIAGEAVRAAEAALREGMRDGTLSHADLRDAARAAGTGALERAGAEARATAERAQAAAKAAAAQSSARLGEVLRRFCARLVDTLTLGMLAATVLLAALAVDAPDLLAAFALPFLALWLMIPVEAVLLAAAGTTPGKALFGLRVTDAGGRPPGFGKAAWRSFQVLMNGLAFGIPMLNVVVAALAAGTVLKSGRTVWDRRLDLRVETRPLSALQWQFGFVAVFCVWVLLLSGVWDELLVLLHESFGPAPR